MTKVGDGGPLNERTADGSFVQAPKADASLWVGVGTSPLLDAKRTDLSGLPDKELQQEGPAENVDPMHGLLHVLVVDDDEAVRKACCKIASGMGFSVVGADSATAARGILKHQRIDLLLLDLKLPGGGGLALLEQVKALYPDTAGGGGRGVGAGGAGEGGLSGYGGGGDDGVCDGGVGGGGDADWGGGLSDEAVCAGGADDSAGADGAPTRAGCAEPVAAGEAEDAAGDGRVGGAVSRDGEVVSDFVEGGLFDASGF